MPENNKNMKITFHGGTGWVTGANFLIEIDSGRFLVDCGMFQGSDDAILKNAADFPYDPASIDVLLVTHSHQDHIGRIPKLVRDGFNGVIYSTSATRDLSAVMLRDAYKIMVIDAKENNMDPIYTEQDIAKTLALWKVIPYHNRHEFLPGASFEMFDAGHVLGSAMFHISYGEKAIVFTGDLGNSPSPLLRDIEAIPPADYMVMESVYGDRLHEAREDRVPMLEKAIEDVVYRDGVLLIPTFSLERTQELLFELNEFVEHGRIPKVTFYLDSPLATQLTEIYRAHDEEWKKEVRSIISSGDDVFQFPGLIMTPSVEDSKKINGAKAPFVVIAGSGMMNGGRIIHHAKQHLSDPKAMVLFVGYQAPNTLGRLIQDGMRSVNIYGDDIPVKAEIRTITGYSGHADRDQLMDFVRTNNQGFQHVFCVMGEPAASQFLAQRLRDYVGVTATAPTEGETVTLQF